MRFRCQFDYFQRPGEPDEFIRPMTVDVMCSTAEGDAVVAGRIAVDHLDLSRASLAGESIYEVCDADSAGWENVYGALFEPCSDPVDPEVRDDFEFHEPVFHPLFPPNMLRHDCSPDEEGNLVELEVPADAEDFVKPE